MENTTEDHDFRLRPTPDARPYEGLMLDIVTNELSSSYEKVPLQCVTFKQPLPEYFRLKAVCKRWHIKYTDLIRFFLRIVIDALEHPTGELLEKLEAHRNADIEKKRLRYEHKRKRLDEVAA